MPKSIGEVTRALKLKAQPKENVLSLRIGTRKLNLPFEVRTIASSDYVFVHIPPAAGILRLTDEGLIPVATPEEAQEAQVSFRQSRKRSSGRAATSLELPPELQSALSKLPAGHKLVFGPDGSPRLVRARKRRKA